jgi:hypothetical protein
MEVLFWLALVLTAFTALCSLIIVIFDSLFGGTPMPIEQTIPYERCPIRNKAEPFVRKERKGTGLREDGRDTALT